MIRSLIALDVGVRNVVAQGPKVLGVFLVRSITALDADKCVVAFLDTIVYRFKAHSVVDAEVAGIEVTGP